MTLLGKIIVGFLLGGAVIGGGYYAITFMKSDSAIAENQQMVAKESSSTDEVKKDSEVEGAVITEKDMSFVDLMKKTGSYECTVKQNVMGITTDGKVKIKDGNMSASFSTTVQGRTIDTNIITKDDYTYSWSSMTPTGVKTKIAAGGARTQVGANVTTNGSYEWNGNTIGSYSCVKASFGDTVFTVPTTITFTEVQ